MNEKAPAGPGPGESRAEGRAGSGHEGGWCLSCLPKSGWGQQWGTWGPSPGGREETLASSLMLSATLEPVGAH